ncbi:MAG TPA: ABC transporter permease, partial [Candidatus Blackburnbacteria bacterium]|nr:ABC transporter permease [Candidatus Blackburnbacteria bacterium]
MTALILRTIKDRWLSVVMLTVISILLTSVYVSMFPELQKQGDKMQELFKAYPKDMMKTFGIEVSSLAFSKIENFIAMEQYSFTWPILVIIL